MTQPPDASRSHEPLRRTLLWRLAAVIGISLLIAILGTFFVLVTFKPSRYTPALVTALEKVTGRQVRLKGPITVRWSLTPTLQANNVSIANPPGFPDPDMLTIKSLRAEIALLPLLWHHVDIRKLVLLSPHLMLEWGLGDHANWDFSTSAGRPGARSGALFNARYKVTLKAVNVKDGTLSIGRHSRKTEEVIHFTNLTGTAASLSAPLHVSAEAAIGSSPVHISGSLGPIKRFWRSGSGPWPINLTFSLTGATLNIAGSVERPREAGGYDFLVKFDIADLSRLGRAVPPSLRDNLDLPPLRHIAASARVIGRDAAIPAINDVSVTGGTSDLSRLRPGLGLTSLNIVMASLDKPFSIRVTGTSESGNFIVHGEFGALKRLLNPKWLPAGDKIRGNFPVSITAQFGSAHAAVVGAIATPHTLSGAALAATADIPDLAALSGLAGRPLPAWKHLIMQTSVVDPGGEGLYRAVGLDGLAITMDSAALDGRGAVYFTRRPRLQMSLHLTRANVDALLAALPAHAATVQQAPVQPLATAGSAGSTALPGKPVLRATRLPLEFLSWGDADIQISADDLVWHGTGYTGLQADVALADNKLTINPFTAETPRGELKGRASLDAANLPASETLSIEAPALALGPLLKSFGLTGSSEGNVQLQLSAASSGSTFRDIASNLSGQLGIASINDQIDTALLDRAFGAIEKTAGLSSSAMPPIAIRCFGLRIDAEQGMAKVTTLGIDSNRLLLRGLGDLNLRQETFHMMFQPFNGEPVQLKGNFAQPILSAVSQSAAASRRSALTNSPRQRPDICPSTLASARLGQPGPAAPAIGAATAPRHLPNTLPAP